MPPCSLPSVVGANFAEGDAPDGSKIKAAQLCHLVRDEGVAGSNPAACGAVVSQTRPRARYAVRKNFMNFWRSNASPAKVALNSRVEPTAVKRKIGNVSEVRNVIARLRGEWS
jgi:hypothetical protein